MNGTISSHWASLLFGVAAALILGFVVFRNRRRFRRYRPRLLRFGGPWSLFQPSFWRDRGVGASRQAVRELLVALLSIAVLFLTFDFLF